MGRFFNTFGAALFPCGLCGGHKSITDTLCNGCLEDLPWIDNHCIACALPLEHGVEHSHCGECLKHPPPFSFSLAPLHYSHPVNRLISSYKYEGDLANGEILGKLLLDEIRDTYNDHDLAMPDAIVPTPLHPWRLVRRGFNQSLELGRFLGKRLNIPCLHQYVIRNKNTRQLQGMNKAERRKNIRGAFTLRRPIPYRRIALLDDVITTGSTATELGKLLKKNGVAEIHVWAVARTDPPS